jgi:hypothetical protein
MKTQLSKIVLALLLISVLPLSAGNPNSASAVGAELSSPSEGKALVAYTNPLEAKVQLRIESIEGYLMFKRSMKKSPNYRAEYDLSEMAPGTYALELYADGILIGRTEVVVPKPSN